MLLVMPRSALYCDTGGMIYDGGQSNYMFPEVDKKRQQAGDVEFQTHTQGGAFFIFNPILFPTNSLCNPFSKSVAMKSMGSSKEVA
jgi:hypothetical protein